ncbi:MAG: hypothetical protein C4576_20355 [Desulfobacteraceae bacterium]|nr:MAG: hypothetical protein C4576_20355 [Desulfobacteraceae bacterium]
MGHIYQAATLAGELLPHVDRQSQIFFMTKSDPGVVSRLSEVGLEVSRLPDDDAIFDSLAQHRPDRIIFDKLDVSPILARRIKEGIGCKLIIFTNLTEANQYADVTVLADIGSNFKNIRENDPITGAIHYYGPKYWILRPEFFTYAGRPKNPLSKVRNIMMIFGGSDQSNLTSLVLDQLLQMSSTFEITVVLGIAFAHKLELESIILKNAASHSTVNVFYDLTAVAKTMQEADVVFASPGLSFFESLVVRTPVLGFHQNDLQRDVYRGYLTTLDKSEIHRLPSIIESKSFIFPDDPFVASMEIGRGKDELVDAILC